MHWDFFSSLIIAQQAIQAITGQPQVAKPAPTQPTNQSHAAPSAQTTGGQQAETEGGAGVQNDVLKAVTQLLHQSQSSGGVSKVGIFHCSQVLIIRHCSVRIYRVQLFPSLHRLGFFDTRRYWTSYLTRGGVGIFVKVKISSMQGVRGLQ